MAQEIGLSTSALNALTTSGALKSVRLQDSTYTARVDASEVYALVGKILNAAKRSNRTHQDLVSLDQAIVKSRKKSQIAPLKLVSALLTKSLQLWVTDPEDMSLASAALSKEQFNNWRRGLRG